MPTPTPVSSPPTGGTNIVDIIAVLILILIAAGLIFALPTLIQSWRVKVIVGIVLVISVYGVFVKDPKMPQLQPLYAIPIGIVTASYLVHRYWHTRVVSGLLIVVGGLIVVTLGCIAVFFSVSNVGSLFSFIIIPAILVFGGFAVVLYFSSKGDGSGPSMPDFRPGFGPKSIDEVARNQHYQNLQDEAKKNRD